MLTVLPVFAQNQNAPEPEVIQIDLRILSFGLEQVDELERKFSGGIPDNVIVDLWKAGEGETVAAQSVKTLKGVNAVLEVVGEYIYPTKRVDAEGDSGEAFETRDIGFILNVTPTVNRKGLVSLTLLPEALGHEGSSMTGDLASFTPYFTRVNVTTVVTMDPGTPMIICSGQNLEKDAKLFLLASVQRLTPAGDVVMGNTDDVNIVRK
jgi:Flp pilus assembly secretin CpaC